LGDDDFVWKSGNAPAVSASGRFQFGKSVGRGATNAAPLTGSGWMVPDSDIAETGLVETGLAAPPSVRD